MLYHRCFPDSEARSTANGSASEYSWDAPVDATAVLWSLISQALVTGYNSKDEIEASVYKLRKFDRELLKKRLGDKKRISLELLIRLLRSVLTMRAFPQTFVLIDMVENRARSQVPELLTKIRQMLNEMAPSSNIHALIVGTPVEDVEKALNGVRVVAEDTECKGRAFAILLDDDSD